MSDFDSPSLCCCSGNPVLLCSVLLLCVQYTHTASKSRQESVDGSWLDLPQRATGKDQPKGNTGTRAQHTTCVKKKHLQACSVPRHVLPAYCACLPAFFCASSEGEYSALGYIYIYSYSYGEGKGHHITSTIVTTLNISRWSAHSG
jgi:hypothetical protein